MGGLNRTLTAFKLSGLRPRSVPSAPQTRKDSKPMEAFWQARRAEACVLLSKGGLSAKIARAFLAQHGAA